MNNVELLFMPSEFRDPVLDDIWAIRARMLQPGIVKSIIGHAVSTLHRYTEVKSAKHGSKRKRFITEYGYDVSAATHAFRWLWMGLDLAANPQELQVIHSESRRQFLREVKAGNVSFTLVDKLLRELLWGLKEKEEELIQQLSMNETPEFNELYFKVYSDLLQLRG